MATSCTPDVNNVHGAYHHVFGWQFEPTQIAGSAAPVCAPFLGSPLGLVGESWGEKHGLELDA
jgi:hypothetical protein